VTNDARDSLGDLIGVEEVVEGPVTENMTAIRLGSGDVPVLATPMLLAMVERVAVALLHDRLPPGTTTVGVSAELTHAAPTLVGETLEVRVRVDHVEERRIHLSFKVADALGTIGFGLHQRALMDREQFIEFAERRRSGAGHEI
jgi:fluoroacetyl-CoA thioesterase